MIKVSDFGRLDVSNLVCNSEDPNIYDEQGQHVIAYLLENFSDPLENTLFQKIIKNPELDISDVSTQYSLMSVWSFKVMEHLMNKNPIIENVVRHINWNILVPIELNNKRTQFVNNRSNTKVYRCEKISWFQFGLLDNWTLCLEGFKFCKDKVEAINLNNTLGENIFHVISRSYIKTPRPKDNFESLLEIILPYFNQTINVKNKENKTPIEILKTSMFYKDGYGDFDNLFDNVIDFIKKWDMKYSLENNLSISHQKENKLKV